MARLIMQPRTNHRARLAPIRLGGVDVVSINDVAGSIKNRASLREVPLHPKCRDLLKLAKSKALEAQYFEKIFGMFQRLLLGLARLAAIRWTKGKVIGLTQAGLSRLPSRKRREGLTAWVLQNYLLSAYRPASHLPSPPPSRVVALCGR